MNVAAGFKVPDLSGVSVPSIGNPFENMQLPKLDLPKIDVTNFQLPSALSDLNKDFSATLDGAQKSADSALKQASEMASSTQDAATAATKSPSQSSASTEGVAEGKAPKAPAESAEKAGKAEQPKPKVLPNIADLFD